MAKIVYDRRGVQIGRIQESGSSTLFYDGHGRQIGRSQQSGSSMLLYDGYGRQIARFDGNNTYDGYGRQIGRGNLFLQILYPDMSRIS